MAHGGGQCGQNTEEGAGRTVEEAGGTQSWLHGLQTAPRSLVLIIRTTEITEEFEAEERYNAISRFTQQMFDEDLLCARHWNRHGGMVGNKIGMVLVLMEVTGQGDVRGHPYQGTMTTVSSAVKEVPGKRGRGCAATFLLPLRPTLHPAHPTPCPRRLTWGASAMAPLPWGPEG